VKTKYSATNPIPISITLFRRWNLCLPWLFMKKSLSPGIPPKPSGWGKLLLAAGLFLVFVLGLLQLYAVQNFFFPGNYQVIKLNLVRKDCLKMDKGLTSLQTQIDNLTRLRDQTAQLTLIPSNRALANSSSPASADGARSHPELSWQSMIHAAKKKRVYVARKLNYIEVILKSMDRALNTPCSANGSTSSTRTFESGKTCQQILAIQALLRTYNDRLTDLSKKLEKLEEYGRSPQAKTRLDIKGR
jgi:hypothetical protein